MIGVPECLSILYLSGCALLNCFLVLNVVVMGVPIVLASVCISFILWCVPLLTMMSGWEELSISLIVWVSGCGGGVIVELVMWFWGFLVDLVEGMTCILLGSVRWVTSCLISVCLYVSDISSVWLLLVWMVWV